jgi:dinuclear metal center YbgI/SA1388 family protein
MMILRHELMQYLNQLLMPENFNDYCPNGLQVEGKVEIRKIVTGVTASQLLLDAAVVEKADAILVHHGYFWKNESASLVGMKRARLKTLLTHDINLMAYHLPLDAHPTYGNNVQLAKHLGIQIVGDMHCQWGEGVALLGELEASMTGQEFEAHLAAKLYRKPLYIIGSDKPIKSIAWCTGGAQELIDLAAAYNVNAYLTGEASEQTVHVARELGLNFFAAGHHATERYGVKALGEHLAAKFGIECQFIDIDNPV